MAVTIKSSSMEAAIPYDAGSADRTISVDVAEGEMLVLGLYGIGTINTLSGALVNANGNGDLAPLSTGQFSTKVWLFHKVAEAAITEIALNVTGMYAVVGKVVAQGDDLRFVEADVAMLNDGTVAAGDPIALDTDPTSRSGYRLAVGGGDIPGIV